MRFAVLLAWFVACAAGREIDVERAQAEVEKIKALVDAGAVPRLRLEEAEKALADAHDAAYLRRTLYGQDLTEDETGAMLAAAERRLNRRKAEVARAEMTVEAGARSRLSLTEPLEALDRARREYDAAQSRARLIRELTEMARAEAAVEEHLEASTAAVTLPYGDRYDGDGETHLRDLPRIELAFEGRFAHPLPVSARGQTAVHRSLGFDHRERVDVAVHPDQPEGLWLRHYLESNRIPYFAFRSYVPGKSTAPHIHIGPISGHIAKGG